MYRQCKVGYKNGGESVFWVEDKFAKERKVVMDEDVNKKCIIKEVYRDNTKTKEEIRKAERMFKSFKDHDGAYK